MTRSRHTHLRLACRDSLRSCARNARATGSRTRCSRFGARGSPERRSGCREHRHAPACALAPPATSVAAPNSGRGARSAYARRRARPRAAKEAARARACSQRRCPCAGTCGAPQSALVEQSASGLGSRRTRRGDGWRRCRACGCGRKNAKSPDPPRGRAGAVMRSAAALASIGLRICRRSARARVTASAHIASAASVFGPTTPSGSRPWSRW